MKNKEYWHCYIGPVDSKKLKWGADAPIRMAVEEAFYKMFGCWAKTCGSGWGVTEEQVSEISFATDDLELKYAIVQSYRAEKKKMPLHVKVWALYFKEYPLK